MQNRECLFFSILDTKEGLNTKFPYVLKIKIAARGFRESGEGTGKAESFSYTNQMVLCCLLKP